MRLPGRPLVAVGTTRRAVTAHAGAVLLRDVMEVVGLVSTTDACLGLKQRARGLSEGQFVAAMAESLALGARCLDDLEVARADQAQKRLRGFDVPAPQTAGAWLRRFTLGHIRRLDKGARHRAAQGLPVGGCAIGDAGLRCHLHLQPLQASAGR